MHGGQSAEQWAQIVRNVYRIEDQHLESDEVEH